MKSFSFVLGLVLIAIMVSAGTIVAHAANERIVNGDFGNGKLTGWTVQGYVTLVRNTHSAGLSARLGSRTGQNAQISQSFQIPSGVTGKLSFWYAGDSGDFGQGALTASLVSQDGTIISEWGGQIDSQWHEVTYDIGSQYTNSPLTLTFLGQPNVLHDSGDFGFDWASYGAAYLYVGEVSVAY